MEVINVYNILALIRKSSLYGNAFYLMLNTVANSIIGFIFWIIMARYYSRSDVGIGSALVAASGLVAIMAGMGFGIGLVRFIPLMGINASRLNNTAYTITGTAAGIGALIYLGGAHIWAPGLLFVGTNIWLFISFFLISIITVIYNLIDQSFVAIRSAKYVLWKNIITSLLKMPLPMLCFYSLKGYGIFLSTGISMMVALLISWFYLLPKVYKGYYPRPVWAFDLLKMVIPFSFSNYLAGLLSCSPNFIYPLMVLNVLGPASSASFFMAWMIANVLTIIPASLALSLFAEGSHNPHKLYKDGKRVIVTALALTVPAVAIIFISSSWILHIFGYAYAKDGIGVLHLLVLAMVPLCINSFYITVNQIKKQMRLIIIQTSFVAIASLGLGYWLLLKYGLNGLGFAFTMAQLLLSIFILYPLLKALSEKNEALY